MLICWVSLIHAPPPPPPPPPTSTPQDTGSPITVPSSVPTTEAHQDSIIRRFEKRIRKTHRVANQTDQKLKQHQTALLHFKKELSKHIVKLQELADSGEASARKRLDDVRKKVQQVDKIVPYLTKYIAVNRQAEMQTVAVLKESCTVEIQKMAKNSIPETSTPKESRKSGGRGSKEQTDDAGGATPTPAKLVENPYASLSEVMPQVTQAKARSNYAQLDFSRINSPGGSVRPPSVNYAEVAIGTGGRGVIVTPRIAAQDSSVPEEQASEEPGDQSHDSTSGSHDTTLTPENAAILTPSTPSVLETVREVATPPLSPITNELPAPSEQPPEVPSPPSEQLPAIPPPPTEPSEIPPPVEQPPAIPPPPTEQPLEIPPPVLDLHTTEPPAPVPPTESVEVKHPPEVPQRSSSLEPTSAEPSPSHKAPPPKTARKPPRTSSLGRQAMECSPPPANGHRDSSASDTSEQPERDHSSPARQDASTVLFSAPSVMDRIKVCVCVCVCKFVQYV